MDETRIEYPIQQPEDQAPTCDWCGSEDADGGCIVEQKEFVCGSIFDGNGKPLKITMECRMRRIEMELKFDHEDYQTIFEVAE